MRKIIVLLATVAMTLGMMGTALADHTDFDVANNTSNCSAEAATVGGTATWSSTSVGSRHTNICTITIAGGVANVAASHQRQAWTVDVTTPPTVHTYTRIFGGGPAVETHVVTGGGAGSVTACYNHRGNPVLDFATNSNCLPA